MTRGGGVQLAASENQKCHPKTLDQPVIHCVEPVLEMRDIGCVMYEEPEIAAERNAVGSITKPIPDRPEILHICTSKADQAERQDDPDKSFVSCKHCCAIVHAVEWYHAK
jgi:hypothetical protein